MLVFLALTTVDESALPGGTICCGCSASKLSTMTRGTVKDLVEACQRNGNGQRFFVFTGTSGRFVSLQNSDSFEVRSILRDARFATMRGGYLQRYLLPTPQVSPIAVPLRTLKPAATEMALSALRHVIARFRFTLTAYGDIAVSKTVIDRGVADIAAAISAARFVGTGGKLFSPESIMDDVVANSAATDTLSWRTAEGRDPPQRWPPQPLLARMAMCASAADLLMLDEKNDVWRPPDGAPLYGTLHVMTHALVNATTPLAAVAVALSRSARRHAHMLLDTEISRMRRRMNQPDVASERLRPTVQQRDCVMAVCTSEGSPWLPLLVAEADTAGIDAEVRREGGCTVVLTPHPALQIQVNGDTTSGMGGDQQHVNPSVNGCASTVAEDIATLVALEVSARQRYAAAEAATACNSSSTARMRSATTADVAGDGVSSETDIMGMFESQGSSKDDRGDSSNTSRANEGVQSNLSNDVRHRRAAGGARQMVLIATTSAEQHHKLAADKAEQSKTRTLAAAAVGIVFLGTVLLAVVVWLSVTV